MKYTFILLSGGTGTRMNNSIPKQYMLLAGKPMIMHTIEKINVIEEIEEIIIVCADEYCSAIKLMAEQYGIEKPIRFASAGSSRQASVLSGLKKAVTTEVIIHEAARPFVTVKDFIELISADGKNAIVAVDLPFTVLKARAYVEDTLVRSELVNVQLPQKFDAALLLEAHKKAETDNEIFTEDASLVFHYNPNIKILVVKGKDYNLKITTRIDMLVGELIYDEIFRRRK